MEVCVSCSFMLSHPMFSDLLRNSKGQQLVFLERSILNSLPKTRATDMYLFDNRFLFVTCVCSFLLRHRGVGNNALSMIPQKVQNQKACNVKSDILNHLHCDIGQNPQNHRVVIVI